MFGCYLTATDDQFLDIITDELNKYNLLNDTSFILLFPSLSARHRLIVHQFREKNYPNLFSFSVGEEKNTRRIIICFKSQLMNETNIISTIDNATPSSSKSIDQVNDESSTKRRPDQALYKPPRRSQNCENPSPNPVSVSSLTIEDSQTQNSVNKTTKSKTARPSAEPYVPPSRRSQTVNKESASPLATKTSMDENKKLDSKENDDDDDEEEEEEDWEKLFDSNENSLDNDLTQEIQTKFRENLHIKKPINDYSQWSLEDMQIKEADLAHVVEVSSFPSTFRTEDIFTAFQSLTRSKFDIKWVDDTHALIVFPDATTALDTLQMEHPMFKLCSMSQASAASKKKAKNTSEFLQPFKTRPETSSLTANRRICAALGLKNPMSSDKTKTERQKIESARQQKIRDKEEQKAIWDGDVFPATSTT